MCNLAVDLFKKTVIAFSLFSASCVFSDTPNLPSKSSWSGIAEGCKNFDRINVDINFLHDDKYFLRIYSDENKFDGYYLGSIYNNNSTLE